MLVENLPVPFDRRVWQEAVSLQRAGFEVVVVCPRSREYAGAPFERRDGIGIHRFPLEPATGGPWDYVREYAQAFWRMSRLVRRLSRDRTFDIVHASNPPDFLLFAALLLRRRGARFIFDHHDLVPELYLSRFGGRRAIIFHLLCALERATFRLADVVIATNDSYRAVACRRGGKHPDDVFVVRNAPDPDEFHLVDADPSLRRGKEFLLAYLGMMGPQDGIDRAIRSLAALSKRRSDWHAVFVGDGDVLPEMRRLAATLGLDDVVEFTGRLSGEPLLRVLSTADVCLAPEPPSPLNDVSTMIKIAEYMTIGKPIVAYPLSETKVTAGDAALYADPDDEESFADRIDELLGNPTLRAKLAERGSARARELSWERSEQALRAAYARVQP